MTTKGSAGRKSQRRQRKTGVRRTKTKHSLELGKLVKFSRVREDHFDGLEVVRTEDEQRPKLLRWFARAPWLASMGYWVYWVIKW